MKKEYDFAKMQGKPNPYAKLLKKRVTINISTQIIDYFKTIEVSSGIPYQSLICSYLADCAKQKREITWASRSTKGVRC
jgi:predicted DNA binding CopG/RHH family protein